MAPDSGGHPADLLTRLVRSLRNKGVRSTLVTAARVASLFCVRSRSDRVLAKSLSGNAGEVRSSNLKLTLVTGADSPLPLTMPASWTSDRALMAVFRSYLANGFGSVFAEVDGAAIGYLWWTKRMGDDRPNHPHLVRFGVDLANDDLWIFDLHMLPEHRRHSSEFLTRAEGLAREHGFRRILFCVAADNRPALWLYHRWGWKAVDSVESIEVLRALLISSRGVFLRNMPWSRRQGFDYRTLWRSRSSRLQAAAPMAHGHAELTLPS